MEDERSCIGEAVSNSGCVALAGCLWIVAALLLLPGIWIGFAYGYDLSEWLSLLTFPQESEEVLPWLIRVTLLAVLVGSSLFLGAFTLQAAFRTNKR